MAPLSDPRIVAAFKRALEEGLRFAGYVMWRPRAQEWVRTELPNITLKAIAERMYAEGIFMCPATAVKSS